MSRADDLDRTQELPPEPLDDLAPLQSTDSTPVPRPERIQTISLPLPLDELSSDDVEHDRMIARELASRRMSIARREQRHRHSIERAEQRHRHEQRLLRRRQEARIVAAVLVLVVASGLAWILLPAAEAAQIVFTTSFGAVAGYLGARSRRDERQEA
ncbi:MAG: hypothetical protein H6712_18195 [Myxococcales bacterium]|nr:hypothetical protein [Myxococcales bacterium]MCB9715804.1 hypothetical protein [Myxococcales bacterium]